MKPVYTALIGLVIFISCSGSKDHAEENSLVQILTPQGEIVISLSNATPRHRDSFLKLVNEHYFDSFTFNRVISNFVIQGGCPDTAEGFSDSPYLLEPEFVDSLRHVYGAVGAGRDDNPEKLSAGCQFYIVQNKEGLARLDNSYTVFAHVIKGMDVVDAIAVLPTDSLDAPLQPITWSVKVLDSAEK